VRVVILGGTRFVGRAIVAALAADHALLVVHRGDHEPPDLPEVEHLHVARADLGRARAELEAFGADAVVDVGAMNGDDARAAADALPGSLRRIVISSMDVYRAYEALHSNRQTDAVPLDEGAPLRSRRHIDGPEVENLEVEEVYLPLDATVLRLGAVYGEHDHQDRLDFVLRRVRAGRPRIPIGPGTFLFSRVYVGDVARAVELALRSDAARGEVLNVCEQRTWPYRRFAEEIVRAAGSRAELVAVAEPDLPADMLLTASMSQHLLGDAAKARAVLGWEETDPIAALAITVEWNLAHPPPSPDPDFSADDRALDRAVG
jgi:nucleoside-diphosphate-sugar epimerase